MELSDSGKRQNGVSGGESVRVQNACVLMGEMARYGTRVSRDGVELGGGV